MACMACLTGRLSGLTLGTGKAPSRAGPLLLRKPFCGSRPALTLLQRSHDEVGGRHAMTINCGKLKTRKAAAKRFKITGSGKIMMRRPGKQHINEKKSPKRLRELGKELEVDRGNKEHIVRNLPYAKLK